MTARLDRRGALQIFATANTRWQYALRATRGEMARIKELADAAEDSANALRLVHAAGAPWTPNPNGTNLRFPYEVTAAAHPNDNHELWEELDDAVIQLGEALTGESTTRIARAYEQIADILLAIHDAMQAAVSAAEEQQDRNSG